MIKVRINCPQFCGNWDGEFKLILAAENKHVAWSLCPGVISDTLLGITYSSPSLDKSYGSPEDWTDFYANAQEKEMLFSILSGLVTRIHQCLE
jgi:hypothetical protein